MILAQIWTWIRISHILMPEMDPKMDHLEELKKISEMFFEVLIHANF